MGFSGKSKAFTLIELMIVVALIGVLILIAVPIYQDYGMKSRRTDAINTLLKLQAAQEKYRTTHTEYAGNLEELDWSSGSIEGYYSVAIESAGPASYLITATPQPGGPQANDVCGTFAINQDGPDHTGSYAEPRCWGR